MEEASYWEVVTERRARMATLGEIGPKTKRIWIVLHGYRQLAGSFVRKFQPLLQEGTFLAAPEGLSRFYLDNKYYGRVGASWMTKEDRLHEIEDQLGYLDRCLEQIHAASAGGDHPPKIFLLGFSQGVATAWRWLLHRSPDISGLVLWAGKPPEETSESLETTLKQIPCSFVYGDSDPFFAGPDVEKMVKQVLNRYPNLQLERFSGKHEILSKPLQEVFRHWA